MSKRSSSLNCNSNSFGPMRPIRAPYWEPMMAAYKKGHATDAVEAPTELWNIRRGKYCSKCLLHVRVCRAYAKLPADILKTKDTNLQTEAETEKKEETNPKSEGGAVGGEEAKEN